MLKVTKKENIVLFFVKEKVKRLLFNAKQQVSIALLNQRRTIEKGKEILDLILKAWGPGNDTGTKAQALEIWKA